MNILFVTPAPPFPPNDGARLIVANLARALAREHTLYLVTFAERDGTAAEMREWFAETRTVLPPNPGKAGKWLSSFTDPLPVWVRGFDSDRMRGTLRKAIQALEIDVVHLDTAKMAQYTDAVAPLPTVLAPHDSLTLVLEQWQTTGPTLRDRAYARYQVEKMRRYETTQYLKGTRVCVVTTQEQQFLQSLAPTLAVRVIPNGVDTDYFAPINNAEKPAHIGFLGVMDYIPNRRAALYFARAVMPRVWQAVPKAVFTIIGRNPTRDILALTDDTRIRVTGTVQDVRPYVAEQQVMVVPMREAGGIKNKLLEAMAMGKAVVTTPEGLEGTDARHDQELLVAAGADALADACRRLIRDDSRRAELGVRARAWAWPHSWQEVASQYLALYREAIHAAAGR